MAYWAGGVGGAITGISYYMVDPRPEDEVFMEIVELAGREMAVG